MSNDSGYPLLQQASTRPGAVPGRPGAPAAPARTDGAQPRERPWVLFAVGLAIWLLTSGIATAASVPLTSVALGIAGVIAGASGFVFAQARVVRLLRFFFNADLSQPRVLGDLQQRSLVVEVALGYLALGVLGAAVAHHGLFLLDSDASPGIRDALAGSTNHLYLFWFGLLNAVTQGIASVTQPRYDFVSTWPAQLWSLLVTLAWFLQTVTLVADVFALEMGRRERRRDHDPDTV
jgi:hypothetical protein